MKRTATGQTGAPAKGGRGSTISAKTFAAILLFQESMGAERVTEQEYERRLEVCRNCPRFGRVMLQIMQVDGCTLCGCPAGTKPRLKTHFSVSAGGLVETACPVNKW